ncbi:ABC transporter permease [Sphaerisporangium sp. NPDC051011]|uniref:ABC transporter permease n=1 Tax=Sphaerisporangium sp. NPDC051011 TaxID=3155792 RepID=UPI0033D6F50C
MADHRTAQPPAHGPQMVTSKENDVTTVATPPDSSKTEWRPTDFAIKVAQHPRAPIVVALIGVCVTMSVLSDAFLTQRNLTNVLAQSSVVGIAAVGATFIIITGGIDLSVGSNVALAGMVTATAVNKGFPPLLGVALCVLLAVAVGAFNGSSVAWLGLVPFIVTLASLGMGRGLTLQISEGQSVYGLPETLTWLGGGEIGAVPVPLITMLVVFAAGHLVLTRTTLGHKIFAIGGNRQAARLSGIRDKQILFIVYVIAGLCAGVAALILVGRIGAATPTAGTGLELQVIAAVVIGGCSLFGGKGSMIGTLIGILLIGVINNGLTLLNVSPFWVQFIQGALIFLAVLLDAFNQRRLKTAAI